MDVGQGSEALELDGMAVGRRPLGCVCHWRTRLLGAHSLQPRASPLSLT